MLLTIIPRVFQRRSVWKNAVDCIKTRSAWTISPQPLSLGSVVAPKSQISAANPKRTCVQHALWSSIAMRNGIIEVTLLLKFKALLHRVLLWPQNHTRHRNWMSENTGWGHFAVSIWRGQSKYHGQDDIIECVQLTRFPSYVDIGRSACSEIMNACIMAICCFGHVFADASVGLVGRLDH